MYLFTWDMFTFFYNLEDDTYYRTNIIMEGRVYTRWCKNKVRWIRTEKFDYIEPVNIIYDNSTGKLLSDMCYNYKEKLIFDKL